LRRLGIVAERLAHLADGHPKAVIKLNEGVFRPQTLPDFLPGDDFPGPLHQHQQQSIRQILESDADAVPR
jgi:hypothetical protein